MSSHAVFGLIGAISLSISLGAVAASPEPLVLEHRFALPDTVKGHFDHFEVDTTGKRLFGTAVEAHQFVVIDLDTGHLIRSIPVDTPRGAVYREKTSDAFT